jgi:hypothetical protein
MRNRGGELNRIAALILIILVAVSAYSFKSYSILSRGLVRDNSTGLFWTRCPLALNNKPVYDFNCNSNFKSYTWVEAVDACQNLVHEGRSDWRLPNIKELASILQHRHYSEFENCSQINDDVFPGIIKEGDCFNFSTEIHYWSSTPHKNYTEADKNWWFIDFKFGSIGFSSEINGFTLLPIKKYVRCVAGP